MNQFHKRKVINTSDIFIEKNIQFLSPKLVNQIRLSQKEFEKMKNKNKIMKVKSINGSPIKSEDGDEVIQEQNEG